MARKRTTSKKKADKKTIYLVTGLVAILIGVLIWKRNWVFVKVKEIIKPDNDKIIPPVIPPSPTPTNNNVARKGVKGNLVRQVQSILVKYFGNSILPRFGVDGDWGSETEAAVTGKGLPNVVYANQLADFEAKAKAKANTSKNVWDNIQKNWFKTT